MSQPSSCAPDTRPNPKSFLSWRNRSAAGRTASRLDHALLRSRQLVLCTAPEQRALALGARSPGAAAARRSPGTRGCLKVAVRPVLLLANPLRRVDDVLYIPDSYRYARPPASAHKARLVEPDPTIEPRRYADPNGPLPPAARNPDPWMVGTNPTEPIHFLCPGRRRTTPVQRSEIRSRRRRPENAPGHRASQHPRSRRDGPHRDRGRRHTAAHGLLHPERRRCGLP